MAIPARRCVGCALVLVGLLLLYDTYTFLRTDWSPLRVPLIASTELAFGYFLIVCGVVAIVAPVLSPVVEDFAPDASLTLAQSLNHESVELRREKRLPLRRRFSTLPNRGLLSMAVLLVLLPTFITILPQESKGIHLRLIPFRGGPDENCLAGPIVLTVRQQKTSSRMLLNGVPVGVGDLQHALRNRLASRANWEVFVEADEGLALSEAMDAIDAIHSLHASTIVLTPKLKKQLDDACRPR
jgi:biopolymer transport protein ExbD